MSNFFDQSLPDWVLNVLFVLLFFVFLIMNGAKSKKKPRKEPVGRSFPEVKVSPWIHEKEHKVKKKAKERTHKKMIEGDSKAESIEDQKTMPSRVSLAVNKLPSKKEMIIYHEVISKPLSLRDR